jgi:hypothetical protein
MDGECYQNKVPHLRWQLRAEPNSCTTPLYGLIVHKDHSALLSLIADVQRKMGRPFTKMEEHGKNLRNPA